MRLRFVIFFFLLGFENFLNGCLFESAGNINIRCINILHFHGQTINTLGKADAQVSRTQQPTSAAKISEEPVNRINSIEQSTDISANVTLPSEGSISSEEKTQISVGKSSEITLLDQGSLLRCIVRTIPLNGRIRISSTVS